MDRPLLALACFTTAVTMGLSLAACAGDDTSAAGPGGPDATVTEGGADAGHDAPTGCGQSVSDYCASHYCPPFAEALAPLPVRDGGSPTLCLGARSIAAVTCNELSEVTVTYADGATDFVYQAGTLVAVGAISSDGTAWRCTAGPSGFTRPAVCGNPITDPSCGGCDPADAGPLAAPAITARPHVADCTDEQIDAFYNCIPQPGLDAGAGCGRFGDGGVTADLACAACILPTPYGPAGALTSVGQYPYVATNVAGCIALTTGDTSAAGCAGKYAAAAGCAAGACKDQCPASSGEVFGTCAGAAFAGECASALAAATCLFDGGAPNALATGCGVGADTRAQYRALAHVFCGGATPPPSDAGADGGGDAAPADAGVGDAGDAG